MLFLFYDNSFSILNSEKYSTMADLEKLDNLDRRILRILQRNAKLTTKEIAAKLDLTTTPTHERIKRLERLGYIKDYVALVDRKKVDKALLAFCNISLKEHSQKHLKQFDKQIQDFEEVLECFHITGIFDYLLKITVKDMDAYHQFTFNKIAKLSNIQNVQTIFAMNDIKYSTVFPVSFNKGNVKR